MSSRQIFKSQWRSPDEVRELLQSLFVAEVVVPSRTIWLVSPWITDLPVVDNRAGTFAGLSPRWAPRQIRLTEVLEQLLEYGSQVVIATRPVPHNDQVLTEMQDAIDRLGVPAEQLIIHRTEDLHQKGVLGDDYYLSGSMNLTYNGVEILEETLRFDVGPAVVAEARITFATRWGGTLQQVDQS